MRTQEIVADDLTAIIACKSHCEARRNLWLHHRLSPLGGKIVLDMPIAASIDPNTLVKHLPKRASKLNPVQAFISRFQHVKGTFLIYG